MTNQELAIAAASKVCGVPRSKIVSACREWPLVEARMIIVLLLSRDGQSDERISWALNRKRVAVLKSRHNALDSLDYSKAFRIKFDKAKEHYEKQKSLRVS